MAFLDQYRYSSAFKKSKGTFKVLIPSLEFTVMFETPCFPFLVVIKITPLLALAP